MASADVLPAGSQPSDELKVPGVGLPVEDMPEEVFPSALFGEEWSSHFASGGVTLREQRMMAFVSDISDKPEWDRKVFDDAIVEKWRAEADRRPDELDGDVVLSKEMFDFVGFSSRAEGGEEGGGRACVRGFWSGRG